MAAWIAVALVSSGCSHFRKSTTRLDYWAPRVDLSAGLLDRIAVAPPEFVADVRKENQVNDIPDRPEACPPTDELISDIRAAIAKAPPGLIEPIAPRIFAISILCGIGSSGLTEAIRSPDGSVVGVVIVLDAVRLRARPNEWFASREGSAFRPGKSRLVARLEKDADNVPRNTIEYLVHHELAHAYGLLMNIHPDWGTPWKDEMSLRSYPFVNASWHWSVNTNSAPSRFDREFNEIRLLRFYTNESVLPAERMPDVYRKLAATNFVNLYAAQSLFDDFAESVASYIHQVRLKKPYEIRVEADGATAVTYTTDWSHPRMAEKRGLIEAILGP